MSEVTLEHLVSVFLNGNIDSKKQEEYSSFLKKGNSLMDNDEYSESIKLFEKAIQVLPNLPEAYARKGMALKRLKNVEEAEPWFIKSIELCKPTKGYLYYYYKGVYLLRCLEKAEEGLKQLKRSTKLNPNFFSSFHFKGLAYAKLQKYEQATRNYEKSLSLNPSYYNSLFNLGLDLYTMKQYDRAIKALEDVLMLNPDDIPAIVHIGLCYNKLQKQEKALECFDTALERSPNYAAAHFNKGYVLLKMKKENQAIKSFEKSKHTSQYSLISNFNLGCIEYNLHNYSGAVEYYKEALLISKRTDTNSLINLGICYRRLGHISDAIDLYTEAIELSPTMETPYFNRGLAYQFQEKWDMAILDFRKVADLKKKKLASKNGEFEDDRNCDYEIQEIEEFLLQCFNMYLLNWSDRWRVVLQGDTEMEIEEIEEIEEVD